MTDLLLERTFKSALTAQIVRDSASRLTGCFDLHRVEWRGSFLAAGGRAMACWFRAPDAESARLALRAAGSDISRLWTASVHESSQPADPNVLVERTFDTPVDLCQVESMERSGAWCMQTHRVRFVRSFLASDGLRMICLYQAPDAESVRAAQRQAALPVDAIWACQRLGPQDLQADR